MARIKTVGVDEAEGPLKDAYAEVAKRRGSVANVFQAESLNPEVMRAHLDFYMATMYGRSGLSRREREMIAMTVSNANECRYCTTHHAEALGRHLKDAEAIRAIRADYGRAPMITAKERAMLDYALKVTKAPAAVNDADIARLREAGLADADVLDATFVAAYFNFVNRLVLGLGVDLETETNRTYRY